MLLSQQVNKVTQRGGLRSPNSQQLLSVMGLLRVAIRASLLDFLPPTFASSTFPASSRWGTLVLQLSWNNFWPTAHR